jgi:predicted O-methyltransferase YrrM
MEVPSVTTDTIPEGIRVALDASKAATSRGLPGMTRIFNELAQMRMPERILLYALVYGLKPRYALEIGTSQGGSALIICGAMDDTSFGRLVCVDQHFQISDRTWSLIYHRVTRLEGRTPTVLTQAAEAVPGKFELAFIDGDHSTDGLLTDIEGTLPLMADRAWLLFHDSYHPPVRAALDEAVRRHSPWLTDAGELSVEQTVIEHSDVGVHVWGGLRMMRFERREPR